MTTKEKILWEALNLFSVRGFDAVPVRGIASAVGIRESALYRHYRNKRDIYDSILNRYQERMGGFFSAMQLANAQGEFPVDDAIGALYGSITEEQLVGMGRQIFRFFFTDDLVVKVRRMLTIEQYGSKEAGGLFRKYSFDDAISYQSQVFQKLVEAGLFWEEDPTILALEFISPIFLLFYKFDNSREELARAEELVVKHIRHFRKCAVKQLD